MIRRTYKCRAYPSVQVQANANHVMRDVMRPIYNAGQDQRQKNYEARCKAKAEGKKAPAWIGRFGQYSLVSAREHPEYAGTTAKAGEYVRGA